MAKHPSPKYGDTDYWSWMRRVGGKALKLHAAGKGKKIKNPDGMWDIACEYFQETDEVHIVTEDVFKSGDLAGIKYKIEHRRPYSWAGFNRFVFSRGIVTDVDDYRFNSDNAYSDYAEVMRRIAKVMYEQKFDGASSGVFSANIIARDLQLQENTNIKADIEADVKSKSDITVKVDYTKLSDAALEEIARLQTDQDDKP